MQTAGSTDQSNDTRKHKVLCPQFFINLIGKQILLNLLIGNLRHIVIPVGFHGNTNSLQKTATALRNPAKHIVFLGNNRIDQKAIVFLLQFQLHRCVFHKKCQCVTCIPQPIIKGENQLTRRWITAGILRNTVRLRVKGLPCLILILTERFIILRLIALCFLHIHPESGSRLFYRQCISFLLIRQHHFLDIVINLIVIQGHKQLIVFKKEHSAKTTVTQRQGIIPVIICILEKYTMLHSCSSLLKNPVAGGRPQDACSFCDFHHEYDLISQQKPDTVRSAQQRCPRRQPASASPGTHCRHSPSYRRQLRLR